MSEPGDHMETTDLTHLPEPDDPQAPPDQGGPVSVHIEREPRHLEEAEQEVVFDVRDLSVRPGAARPPSSAASTG